jgi:tetratricopeptide (TPR) repeat protein
VQEVAADVIREDPSDVARWIEYGRVCELSGNHDGAIQAYEYALELDDTYVPAYEHLGAAYQKIGRRDQALQTYQKAIVTNQLHSPLLWLGCAYCLVEAKEYDAALQLFQKVESAAESGSAVHVSALLGRASVLRAQGQDEQAEAAIATAAAADPEILELLKDEAPER